jgi:hypothetical protein
VIIHGWEAFYKKIVARAGYNAGKEHTKVVWNPAGEY